ncbi:ATP-grasp enzyme [Amycolatopsis sp. cmx-4-83]|uniref:ATP-grasp enzyme n=1 Tax=Amycolatopsis sp. cmx-4-83 TaxID=2790940 RepID=UPI0039784668
MAPDRRPRDVAVLVARSLGMQGLLLLALPPNLLLTAVALVRSMLAPAPRSRAAEPRTVLVTGGKMTKALTLARAFHAAGHRVVLVESPKYRFTGHRFSVAVDRFHVVPAPDHPGYADALLDIVLRERVDVFVPVSSPASSRFEALAGLRLAPYCQVVHGEPARIGEIDDKARFAERATTLGLPVPETHRITRPEQVAAFDFASRPVPYILKSIVYDPLHRLDLTRLPRPTAAETENVAAAKPISHERPWILQEFVDGTEYCTHSTVRDGRLQVHCCCASSAFQLNYSPVDKPVIEEWVRRFVGALELTGQYSFDFIELPSGEVFAIECNPRAHSAITLFRDHPGLARAYLEPTRDVIRPLRSARPTYWFYWELWRLLKQPGTARERIRVVVDGRDAIFDWADPLPFLLVHHLQVPWLLLGNLVRLKEWVRIDVNIGKLVEPGGE